MINGYPDYGPPMAQLWEALGGAGLSEVSYAAYDDWLTRKPPPLATCAEVETLGREALLLHLFRIERDERFCDGHWVPMLDQGMLLAFARRLRALNSERA